MMTIADTQMIALSCGQTSTRYYRF